ncbi:MAG: deoxyguanosinetriphosphate triphosphohydrolase [Rickettsiales bacterium]
MKLATFAVDPVGSAGRKYRELYESNREPFLKDRERIIHSVAFRRLEYKTQVFVNHVGDHYRTRLTHSLEVAQISRAIARDLQLNEDLAELIALAHDIGHPPFGHAGEDGLNEAAAAWGGFDHNVQTLKTVTKLEQRYAEFDGLNLSWESLEGIVKHNGPFKSNKESSQYIFDFSAEYNLHLDSYASLEAQVASLADDIAYINHDIDDGIRAGFFTLEQLQEIPLVNKLVESVKAAFPNISETKIRSETIRRLIKHMTADLVFETRRGLDFHKIKTVLDVRKHKSQLAVFSPEVEKVRLGIKEFLMNNFYRHYQVNRMTLKGQMILKDLFKRFLESPGCLPNSWQGQLKSLDDHAKARVILDYISGMTDRYAIEEHKKLFNAEYF